MARGGAGRSWLLLYNDLGQFVAFPIARQCQKSRAMYRTDTAEEEVKHTGLESAQNPPMELKLPFSEVSSSSQDLRSKI